MFQETTPGCLDCGAFRCTLCPIFRDSIEEEEPKLVLNPSCSETGAIPDRQTSSCGDTDLDVVEQQHRRHGETRPASPNILTETKRRQVHYMAISTEPRVQGRGANTSYISKYAARVISYHKNLITRSLTDTRSAGFSTDVLVSTTEVAQKIYYKALKVLNAIRVRESDIPPNHKRLRWTNVNTLVTALLLTPSTLVYSINYLQRSGMALYDDYIEHELGALQALQDYLNFSKHGKKTEAEIGHSPTSTRLVSPESSDSGSRQAIGSYSSDIADQGPGRNRGNITSSGSQTDLELGQTSTNTLHLLSCMETKKHTVNLHQEPVTHITDDRQLFRLLKQSYCKHRAKSRWSLRTVSSIHFMKVRA